jgi:hypothetical protein
MKRFPDTYVDAVHIKEFVKPFTARRRVSDHERYATIFSGEDGWGHDWPDDWIPP